MSSQYRHHAIYKDQIARISIHVKINYHSHQNIESLTAWYSFPFPEKKKKICNHIFCKTLSTHSSTKSCHFDNFQWSCQLVIKMLSKWQHLHLTLTHLPLDKMAAISKTIFSNAFLWMKSFVFRLKFHWSLFLWVQLTITQHRFR